MAQIKRWFICCVLILISASGRANAAEPSSEELAQHFAETMKTLETKAASWTAIHTFNSFEITIRILTTSTQVRYILEVSTPKGPAVGLRMVVKDGTWYVVETDGVSGKFRPYEVPFHLTSMYLFLVRSELRAPPAKIGVWQKTDGTTAVYRTPLPDQSRAQLEQTRTQLQTLVDSKTANADQSRLQALLAQVTDLLQNGVRTDVDLTTGLLTGFGAPGKRTNVKDFKWLDSVGEQEFAMPESARIDHTADPTVGDLNELVYIGNAALFTPGGSDTETDGRLLNLKTGELRRVPFVGTIASGGCFTKDRRKLLITGLPAEGGKLGLYELDLKTGANRALGGTHLATGFTLFPVLSHDGKTVAVIHKDPTSGQMLEVQIFLVNLASGEARPLGKPGDMAYLSWMSDDQGLLLLQRQTDDPDKPSINTISRMNLQGEVTPILKGDCPVLLGDDKTILFQDREKNLWNTCDLEGKSVQLLGDGLARYGFPAPAPDGRRILMMHFEKGKSPQPMLITVEGKVLGPATKLPGLWASPCWR